MKVGRGPFKAVLRHLRKIKRGGNVIPHAKKKKLYLHLLHVGSRNQV